jgi:asparagine synthase (glutamine-hydrolysing)
MSVRHSEQSQHELVTIVARMAAAMCYEPCYSVEIVPCPDLGACVGRVGFSSAGDSSEVAARPANLVVVTTGEPLSDATVGTAVQDDDTCTIGGGAYEVMLAYRRSGEDGVSRVAGNFAGFLIDRAQTKCLLFNDRYGIERIFLHTDGPRTLFSSEAKAILAVAPHTRAFDTTGLAEFLACGCTLGARSLFRDVEVLDGGMLMTFSSAEAAVRRRYFNRATLEEMAPVSRTQFLEGFSESLRSAVNNSVSRAAVGVSLTGGLDSRMIMASLDAPQGTVPCYTFGSMYRTTFDVHGGRQVAACCGQPHHVLELGSKFLADIRQHLERSVYISDGYVGLSGAAELYLNRTARSIALSRMTGNWGGELMRGVRAFKCVLPKAEFIHSSLMQQMSESAAAFASAGPSHPLSFALFHQLPFQGFGRHAIERSQVLMRSPFLATEVVTWLYRAPASVRASTECASAIISRRPELLAVPTDAGCLGTGAASVRFVRRAYRRAMAKTEYLTSHGAPNWVAALAASLPSRIMETRFLGRDKFQHFRLWIRNEFAAFVRETLVLDSKGDMERWFDMRRVVAMVEDHIAGRGNHTEEIDKLMTIALAQRTLLTRFEDVRSR